MIPPQLPAPLVLASTSKYRIAQLQRLGVPFTAVAPDYPELPVAGLAPAEHLAHHARQKALAVAAQRGDAWILAADQGVLIDGELLGKPHTEARAVAQLLQLAGRSHLLRTAVALWPGRGPLIEQVVDVTLTVRPLDAGEALAYVRADQPLDCAGSYRIESLAPWILASASGDDPTAIEGLPLLAVAALLRQALGRS